MEAEICLKPNWTDGRAPAYDGAAMRRRFRLYLDAAFWNRLGDPLHPPERRISYHFLNRACAHQDVLISPLVIEEVRNTPDPVERRVIERQLRGVRPTIISGQQRAEEIAEALRREGRFGDRMLADLAHVAYAVMGAADAVVTWDVRTLARDRVRVVVHAYCRRARLEPPLIGIPEDVAQWLELAM